MVAQESPLQDVGPPRYRVETTRPVPTSSTRLRAAWGSFQIPPRSTTLNASNRVTGEVRLESGAVPQRDGPEGAEPEYP